MNRILVVTLVFFLCLASLSVHAVQPTLKADTLGAVYFNALRLQELLSREVTRLSDPANAEELAVIEKGLKNHTKIQKLPFAKFVHGLKEMYDKNLLQPKGALWLAVDNSYMPQMSMPASIKPVEFYAFLQEKIRRLRREKPDKKSEEALSFNFSNPGFCLDFDLEKNGMFLNSSDVTDAKDDLKVWKDMLKTVEQPDCLMALELNMDEIKKLPVVDSFRSFAVIIETIAGARFVVNTDSALLSLRINSKEKRENINAMINSKKLTVRTVFENLDDQLSKQDKQRGLKMIDSVKSVIDDEWIKISVSGFAPESAMWGVVGLVIGTGHMATPNIKKARNIARAKACAANRRVLHRSTKMRLNEKPEGANVISPKELVKSKYLSDLPQCPAGGKYNIRVEDGQVKVECSVHGSD